MKMFFSGLVVFVLGMLSRLASVVTGNVKPAPLPSPSELATVAPMAIAPVSEPSENMSPALQLMDSLGAFKVNHKRLDSTQGPKAEVPLNRAQRRRLRHIQRRHAVTGV